MVVFDNNCKDEGPPQQWDPGEAWKPMEQEKPGLYEELVVFGEVRGGKQELILKRVYCEGPEHHTHVILPEFVIPYVRYLCTYYEQVINSEQNSQFKDVSTVKKIKNWWNRLRDEYDWTVEFLKRRLKPLLSSSELESFSSKYQSSSELLRSGQLASMTAFLASYYHPHFSVYAVTSP